MSGGYSFDERTAKRLIREAKRSMRAPRTRKKRERRYRAIGGGGRGGTVVGALAIIKGTVPASSGIDVTGTLTSSSVVITLGVLDVTATADTFSAGALLITPEGKPIFVEGDLRAVAVVNPAYTNFIGEGDGVGVCGTLYVCDPPVTIGETEYSEFFLLPTSEIRTRPNYDETKGNIVMVQPGDSGVEMVVTGWSANDKSLGADTTGDAEWQDDGACS